MIIANIASKRLSGWNRLIFTEERCLRICKKLGVQVIEGRTGELGRYLVYGGVEWIILDPSLRGGARLWVLLHETAHHLLHAPNAHAFSPSTVDKMNYEANFIAVIAMMPTWLVKSKLPGEIMEEFDYPKEVVDMRKDFCDRFKF